MNYVLDACAMIAYLRGEPGHSLVIHILEDPGNQCFAHSINLCEVYYEFVRAENEEAARQGLRRLEAAGVTARPDLSPEFWQAAGLLKAVQRRISLADCFAVTLANVLGGTVLTSDRREFAPLLEQGICEVEFIR